MIPPTPQQARALVSIRRLTRNGIAPTFEELRQDLGLASVSNVHRLIHGLRDRGQVAFEPGCRRTLRILAPIEIDLEAMTAPQLVRLRERIEATLINRWKS